MPSLLFTYKYLLLVPVAAIEGPMVAVACGVGVALHYINPFLAYFILIVGDVGPDILYYGLGRWSVRLTWVRRTASRVRLIRDNLLPLERLWHTKLFLTLASTKFAYGAAAPLLVSAGMSGVPFWRFVGYSLCISSPFLAALMAIGYGFTKFYGRLNLNIAHSDAIFYIAAGGLLFISFLILMMYYTRKHMNLSSALEESNIID